jgi:hypothetical protein
MPYGYKYPINFIYNVRISKGKYRWIKVINVDKSISHELKRLGGGRKFIFTKTFEFVTHSDKELVELFANLRDIGCVFAAGQKYWGPAEIFEDLRENGEISGKYKLASSGGIETGWQIIET